MRGTLIVAVLALQGCEVGSAVTELGPPSCTDEFYLHHSRDASHLASVARVQHVHGIRVRVLDENTFQITGHGSAEGAAGSVEALARHVRKAIDRIPNLHYAEVHGDAHRLPVPSATTLRAVRRGSLPGLRSGSAL